MANCTEPRRVTHGEKLYSQVQYYNFDFGEIPEHTFDMRKNCTSEIANKDKIVVYWVVFYIFFMVGIILI